jgi:hypothetical protein
MTRPSSTTFHEEARRQPVSSSVVPGETGSAGDCKAVISARSGIAFRKSARVIREEVRKLALGLWFLEIRFMRI